jgi:hypothetical protein
MLITMYVSRLTSWRARVRIRQRTQSGEACKMQILAHGLAFSDGSRATSPTATSTTVLTVQLASALGGLLRKPQAAAKVRQPLDLPR